MKKLNRLGFTLIKLLAVILILGIIALIAISTVGDVIKEVKLGALSSTTQNIAKAIEENCQMQRLRGDAITNIYNITNGISDIKIDVKGDLPEEATIIVNDECNVMISAIKDNLTAIKDFNDTEVIVRTKKVEKPYESCFTYEDVEGGVEIKSYSCGDSPNFSLFTAEMLNFYNNNINNLDEYRKWDKEALFRDFIKYNNDGKYTDIILPDTLDGKKVVGIGKYAFSYFNSSGITSIKLNNSLKYIKKYAFTANEINKIEFNEGLEVIEPYALSYNNLTEIALPSSIIEIGIMAFGNNLITNYSIPNTIQILGNGFMNDNYLPDSRAYITKFDNMINDPSMLVSYGGINKYPVIPSAITNIGENAFFAAGISNVTIPATVTHIQNGAFNNNTFSDSDAFIYKRNIDGSVDFTTLVSYAGTKMNVIIPNNVINIGDYALYSNVLKSVTLSNNLKNIGMRAFANNDLKTINIPNNIEEIEERAFEENYYLTIINIDKESGTLENSPWGATGANINYLR